MVPISSVYGGVSRPGGQGSIVYVLFAEPKEHKQFRPGTRRSDRGDPEIVDVPNSKY